MLPNNAQLSRGDAPFSNAAAPGRIYRFFSETVPVTPSDGAPSGNAAPGFITRDLVEVLQAGDNKSIPVRVASADWLAANPAAALAYDAWKRGRSMENGAPLDAWAGIDRNMVAACAVYNVHTVEQLAAVDDERLLRLGMGARDMQARARLYLESRADAAAVERTQAEKARLTAQLAAQERQMQEMQAQIAALTAFQRENIPAPAGNIVIPAENIVIPAEKPPAKPKA